MESCLNCIHEKCMWKFEWGNKCDSYKRKLEKKTEYAVELNNEKGFVRQLEVFDTYEKAVNFQEKYNEPLSDGEYLNIIYIDYDENGDEIGFGSVV